MMGATKVAGFCREAINSDYDLIVHDVMTLFNRVYQPLLREPASRTEVVPIARVEHRLAHVQIPATPSRTRPIIAAGSAIPLAVCHFMRGGHAEVPT